MEALEKRWKHTGKRKIVKLLNCWCEEWGLRIELDKKQFNNYTIQHPTKKNFPPQREENSAQKITPPKWKCRHLKLHSLY